MKNNGNFQGNFRLLIYIFLLRFGLANTINDYCTSEILNTHYLTPFFDYTISIYYSLPTNTNTIGYCVPKTGFKR